MDDLVNKLYAAFDAGRTLAERHLQPGVRFMGAMQLADALGYARGTQEHHMATQGAMVHYNNTIIITTVSAGNAIVTATMPK